MRLRSEPPLRLDTANQAALDYYLLPRLDFGQNRISLAEQNAIEFESYGCELAQECRIGLDRLGHFHAVDAFDNLLQENEIHRSVYLIQIAFTDAELLQQ